MKRNDVIDRRAAIAEGAGWRGMAIALRVHRPAGRMGHGQVGVAAPPMMDRLPVRHAAIGDAARGITAQAAS